MEAAQECGASSWLTALPLVNHGFFLTKSEFRDAVCLRYGWTPARMPGNCACGQSFSVEHALSCTRGGYVAVRHNEIRDAIAALLEETCHNVEIEPALQPLSGESFRSKSVITSDGARLDIKAGGFWGGNRHELAYFDVRIFNPHASSYRCTPLDRVYRQHEAQKRRAYGERVREVENANFSPLVFSCTGGSSPSTTVFLKRLGSLLSEKRETSYAETMGWLRCHLAFALLRASVLCLRGSRPTARRRQEDQDPTSAIVEARVSWGSG